MATGIYEYYNTLYYTLMYVFGFPIFFIMCFAEGWDISNINYDKRVADFGLNFLDNEHLGTTQKAIEFHYIYWARNYSNNTEGLFVKFLLLPIHEIVDLFTMATGIVGFTLGAPLNFSYLVTILVFQWAPQ